MKKALVILTLASIWFITSCGNKKKDQSLEEKTLEELAVDYQVAYRNIDYPPIEPYLSSKSKIVAKKIFTSRPVPEEKREQLIKAFEGKENKVISKTIETYNAKVVMCCNGFGDSFTTYWVLEDGKWKVDFVKTMNIK
jgi:hypothetical protein